MLLTVFTPAYNRAALLPRLFESLKTQTCFDFEWLIIDDGSTDDTQDVVNSFACEDFTIRYIKKENGGKHTAHNLAVTEAKGELFFCVDSDDWLPERAVENIKNSFSKMSDRDYAIIAYKSTADGRLLSNNFTEKETHMGFYKLIQSGACGEFSLVMTTKIIKDYPFPVINGERFSGENVLYDLLELKGYTVFTCNFVLTVCEYQENGLSNNFYNLLKTNPTAFQIYHLQRIDLVQSLKERVNHILRYHAFKFMSKNKEYIYKGPHKILVFLTAWTGIFAALYYKHN